MLLQPIESTVPVSDHRVAGQRVEAGMSLRSSRTANPFATVLIAMYVLVIWALATTGQPAAARS
jgi:hypothetical protein